nr:acyl CoA:acetate/3-ketoacid CoA transferase [Gelria sp. Kuro-4]
MMSVQEAAQLIKDGDTVWIVSSGGGVAEPGYVLAGIEERFLKTGRPRDLTVCHASGIGDRQGGGTDHFAYEGLVKRVVGSHWTWAPRLSQMVVDNLIEAYVLPQGVMTQLTRAIAGGKPGVLTHVGIGTYIDPRLEGGRLNTRSQAELVKVVELEGREWLLYKSFPVDVTIIRGTSADEDGNITMEHEGVIMEALPAAQAAKNSGGIVIAQVKRLAQRGTLDPRLVKVPGILVDAVVVNPGQMQSCEVVYDPAYSGELRVPLDSSEPMPLNERKIVARRAAMELYPGAVCNLGFGMSDGVAAVAAEEGISNKITLTVEQGVIGGIPALGVNFGLAANPVAFVDHASQFDWYDGGGLDITFLAFAQADQAGNVNVSRFGKRIVGVGGFVNISQNAKKVVFCGSFSTSGLEVAVEDERLRILKEGRIRKLVPAVEQISFSSSYALKRGQAVLYVTERAVFELCPGGLVLTEIAPGIDLETEVLAQMDLRPIISPHLRVMDARIFRPGPMGLKEEAKFQEH